MWLTWQTDILPFFEYGKFKDIISLHIQKHIWWECQNVISTFGSTIFYIDNLKLWLLAQAESKKLTKMRDPLFVIGTSLEIIKHQSTNTEITPEIKRIENALNRIEEILK